MCVYCRDFLGKFENRDVGRRLSMRLVYRSHLVKLLPINYQSQKEKNYPRLEFDLHYLQTTNYAPSSAQDSIGKYRAKCRKFLSRSGLSCSV